MAMRMRTSCRPSPTCQTTLANYLLKRKLKLYTNRLTCVQVRSMQQGMLVYGLGAEHSLPIMSVMSVGGVAR